MNLFASFELKNRPLSSPPPCPLTLSSGSTSVSCNGGSDGTASITPSGGSGNYSFTWLPGGQTTGIATGLSATDYTVTVTDNIGGCSDIAVITIIEPATINIPTTQQNVSCMGTSTGSATAVPTGGTGAYTYSWNSAPIQNTSTATGLPAGAYVITVSDANSCAATASVSISQPTTLTATSSRTNVLCFGGSSGTATATPAGGTSPYTYSWNSAPVQNTAVANGLPIGNYIATIRDANGCTTTTSVNISQPTTLTATSSRTNVLCFGGSSGTATATPAGGTSPFTYSWNSAPVQNTAVANGLPIGNYIATIRDANGCTATTSVNITQPPTAVTATTSVVNLTCYGYGNGRASVNASGGVPGYTYSWSNGQTTQTISNLAAAVYTVTIRDANGCTRNVTANVTQPPAVITSSSGRNVTCFGDNDGKAWVTAAGTNMPYVYAWNPSLSINDTIFGLTARNYSVTVTDGLGCTQSTVITITQPTLLTGTVSNTTSSCNGAYDATATVTPIGGTPGYTYLWNSTPAQSTATASNLPPGVYTIQLSDANGCEYYQNVTIIEAPPILISVTSVIRETCLMSNGRVNISVIGGTSPYTYSWNPSGQTGASVTNIVAGIYSVTITDSRGCSSIQTSTVTNQFIPPTAFASTTSNISCFGANNGAVNVLPSGGTPAYTYNWSPIGGTSPNANNLPAGTYTATVRDANGCSVTSTTTITEPAVLILNLNASNTSCGSSNGVASVAPTGGTLPYTFSWSTGSTTTGTTGLSAGTYSVILTDARGCTSTQNFTINVANPIAANLSSTNNSCNGSNNGTATSTPTGGGGTYNYTWLPGGSTANSIAGLAAGTYTVTVTDASNPLCFSTETIIITQPLVLNTNITPVNVTCNGSNNGQASSSPLGGTAPFTYSWSTGGIASSIAGLSVNTYSLLVTDANGCTATGTFSITESSSLSVTITAQADATCFGASNGSASVSASGGTGSFTYTWLPVGGAGASATGLPANTYSVIVRDANNCSSTTTLTISQPANLIANPSSVNASCGVSNGSASVSPTGGTAPYTYAWSTGSTETGITNLAPGSYTVTIRDDHNCPRTQVINIIVSNPLVLTPSRTNLNCNSVNDGTATVGVTGGTGSYNYTWMPGGETTSSISGLAPGNYSVTVVDAVNPACLTSTVIAIAQPTVLTATITATPVICFGQANGTVTVFVLGGTPSYTYAWNPSGGTSTTIAGLTAGVYSVTVTDANGCTQVLSNTVFEAPPLTLVLDSLNASCIGSYDGSVWATVGGGAPAYSYSWTPTGAAADSIYNLGTGTYTIVVTDAYGCTITDFISVSRPPAFSITTNGLNPTCYTNNGEAYVVAIGGSGVFTYIWTPGGSTNDTITGLGPGTYQVQVIDDASGCDTIGFVTLAYPVVGLAALSRNVICNGADDGIAWAIASGATPPYTFLWDFNASTNDSITGLPPGTYSVMVTDAGGCVSTRTVSLSEPLALALVKNKNDVDCFSGNDGSATITASGGIIPYTYSWAHGATTTAINSLSAGTYTITLSDDNGCTLIDSVIITQPNALVATTDSVNVTCNGFDNGSASVVVTGGTGPFTYSWNPGGTVSNSISNLAPGTYTVTVRDSYNCSTTDVTTIAEPNAITLAKNSTSTNCGLNFGSANVTASGGTSPYSYVWNNAATTTSITGLFAGTYTATVTDQNGCVFSDTVRVIEPNGISLTLNPNHISCNGANDGSVSVNASGGIGPYLYSWSPGGNTTTFITGLSPRNYVITVTDIFNTICIKKDSVTITEPAVLTNTITATNILCFGATNGLVTASGVGGTSPYTYSWSSGGTTSSISGLIQGNYTVNITDAHGCTSSNTVTISEPTDIITTTNTKQASCGNADGEAYISATGGIGTYGYVWSPTFSTNDSLFYLLPGTYYVDVTNINGCTKRDSAIITLNNGINTTLTATRVSCFGDADGQVTVTANGGSGNFIYEWMPGNITNQTAVNLTAGMYTVTVTDLTIGGCIKIDSILLTEPGILTVSVAVSKTTCVGATNFVVTANPLGGTAPYTYLWSWGGTNQVESGLSPGAYIISVIDANGCDTAQIFNISTFPPPVILTPTRVHPTCNLSNGSIIFSVFSGAPPYTYAWNPITNSTLSASNLAAGNYTLTVTDAYSCTALRATSLFNTSVPPNILVSSNPANCFGNSTGSTSAVVNAGSPPYAYLWSPSGGTTTAATGLPAGVYTITVTDGQACTSTSTTTVTEPADISIALSTYSISCFEVPEGIATAVITGGTPNYTYFWSNAETTSAISNLAIGQYSLTTTDNNGCTKSDTISIYQPTLLTSTISVVNNVSCFAGNNGSATVAVSGGTGLYTYLWNNSQTTNTSTGLIAGDYDVTVTDANGCTNNHTITITEPPLLTLTVTTVLANCLNTNGSATATNSGGTTPYTYLWSNAQTNASATNLASGNYSLVVTDANACTLTNTTTIGLTPSPAANIAPVVDVLCFGDNDGSAIVNVTVGTAPFTYSWTGGQTTSAATGLTAGGYTVTVTDFIGCTVVDSTIVQEPLALTASITPTQVSCFSGNNGTATVTANGGTPGGGYTYLWSNSEIAAATSGLIAGDYSVTITDANGCTISSTVTITELGILAASLSQTDVSCFAGNNGTAISNTTGGTTPYTYAWNNTQTTSAAINLIVGNYSVQITDVNGCTVSDTISIYEPTALTLSVTASIANCLNMNGNATASGSGGVPAYAYLWNNAQIAATATGLAPSNYSVTLTDANGCTITDTVNVQTASIALTDFSNTTACFNNSTMFTDISSNVNQWSWDFGDGATSSLQNPTHTYNSDGSFTVKLVATNIYGCTDSISKTVLVHPVPLNNFSFNLVCQNDSTCFTDLSSISSGSITGWSWNFGDMSSSTNISNLQNPCHTFSSAGSFTVILTVTSNNNCQTTSSRTTGVNPMPTAAFTSSSSCLGNITDLTDASLTIPSDPIVSWNWTMNGGTPTSSALQNPSSIFPTAGMHTTSLIVTTQFGCKDTVDLPVIVHALPMADFAGSAQGCAPVCHTFADSSISADGAISNWAWTFPGGAPASSTDQNPTICYNSPGTYGAILLVTTIYGCTDSISLYPLITVHPWPTADFCISPNAAPASNPRFTFCDLWSSDVVAWHWLFGDGDSDYVNTDPVHSYSNTVTNNDYYDYEVTLWVQNAFGCWDTAKHSVKIKPEFTFFIPNSFTPNGDGINDFFFGKGRGIKEYDIQLFDRWGNRIWDCHYDGKNTDWDMQGQDGLSSYCQWDGNVERGGMDMNGGSKKFIQEDVYVWKVLLIDVFDSPHRYDGHVTVVR